MEALKTHSLNALANGYAVSCPLCSITINKDSELIDCGLVREILQEISGEAVVKVNLNTGEIVHDPEPTEFDSETENDGIFIDISDFEDYSSNKG